ncbi:hypothetical protein [African swine fever virus]|nr:hypothetical protein [African swine fever virus]
MKKNNVSMMTPLPYTNHLPENHYFLSLTVVISIIHLFTTCVPQHNHSTHFPYLNRVLHPNHVRHPNHVLHLNHVLQLNPILHPNHYLVSRYYPISRHYLPKIFRLFT